MRPHFTKVWEATGVFTKKVGYHNLDGGGLGGRGNHLKGFKKGKS